MMKKLKLKKLNQLQNQRVEVKERRPLLPRAKRILRRKIQ